MGNHISIPIGISLDPLVNRVSQWIEEKGGYNYNLENNLVDLERAMEVLKAKREDYLRRLEREEDRGLQRLSEFKVWLERVMTIEIKVNALLSDKDVEIQRIYGCGFFCCGYGEKVFLTLKEVEVLKSQVFDVIVDQAAQTSEVQKRPIQRIIVGQETMLETAWNHLMDDGVGTLGMYGMGGVGKTTLLKQINNKFSDERCGFNFVIWIVVSKELHIEKIQDEIAEKAGLGGEEWSRKDKIQKMVYLYNFLMKKRFVLFLDDIWEKVDLDEIGIPFPTPQNQCKVAFTSRSQAVCASMGAEKLMEVRCLTEKEAFDLFQKKVGQTTLESDPGIPEFAKLVAKKCCGLPLALNIIGETMSGKKTIPEWQQAIHVLNSYAEEFSGMTDKILPIMKYSYDMLKEEHVKSCLLYCALFPEDDKISKKSLIEYWICEEIIDGNEGIESAENKGYEIIGSLVRASLLMDGETTVYMHDVVREMALWIQKEAFIVRAGVGLREIPKVKNWNIVRRMSLMKNKIHHLVGKPECLELTTLLLQSGNLSNISSEFFKYMQQLAVLDLSFNKRLSELPEEISNLISLQYLNLSGTGIHHLPKGLHELKKIIHLNLEFTRELESIAGISSLHNLKVLKLYDCRFPWDLDTVAELEALEHLEILTTTLYRGSGAGRFLNSHWLMSCTRTLQILNSNMESSDISLPVTMDKLRELHIYLCSISEIKMGRRSSFLSLVEVLISTCIGLRELTFLMFAPNLRFLEVRFAKDLEDIINKEKACEVENSGIVPFQKLKKLKLSGLPKLKNIYWNPLPFPCLEKVKVFNCESLRELTFLMFAPNLRSLFVEYAKDLKDIINKEKACEVKNSGIGPFQNLKKLRLRVLPKLKNIYWSPLPFPCLEEIDVDRCKSLRELTFLMFAPNLKSLYVHGAKDLEDIINKEKACEVKNSRIAPFQNLKELRLRFLPKLKNISWSPLPFPCLEEIQVGGCESLRELTFLMFAPNLKSLYVGDAKFLEDIINKEKACEVENSEIVPFQNLKKLTLRRLPKLKNIYWSPLPFPCLKKIDVNSCESLRELTFLMFAPNLKSLYVEDAEDLEDIINKEKACEVENSGFVPFQKLNKLRLGGLPKLKNIYWSPLPFPCLEEIDVGLSCPNLRKLPLDSKSGKNGLVIKYREEEWIEGVEWEDEATKNRFLSSCIEESFF